jgi:hypothetical protein
MPADPPDETLADDPEDTAEVVPADDSFLMGATGVQEQIEAEMLRAEADLGGDAPESDDEGAIV